MSRIIVNSITPEYRPAQDRLRQSLLNHANGIDFSGSIISKSTHLDNPYSFKITAIEIALQAGYKQILWLDSSCYAIRPIRKVFDIIDEQGYFMEEAGHYVGTWTNDFTLNHFGIARDEAMKIPMFSAGFTGINFDTEIGREFFGQWKEAMLHGCFKGAWSNANKTESQDPRCEGHRHDMSSASIIANKLGMKYQKGGTYFQYAAPEDMPANNTVCFFLQGIV